MDQLPLEIQQSIFRYCSWEDRLINLRLVNAHWNETVEFGDLLRLRVASFRNRSKLKGKRSYKSFFLVFVRVLTNSFAFSDGLGTNEWLEQLLLHTLPLMGGSLKSFGIDKHRKFRLDGLLECSFFKLKNTFGPFLRITASVMRALTTACPNLRDINFVGALIDVDAYPALIPLAPTLECLTMITMSVATETPHVTSVLAQLRLRRLAIDGIGVSDLDKITNGSSLESLVLSNYWSLPTRMERQRHRHWYSLLEHPMGHQNA